MKEVDEVILAYGTENTTASTNLWDVLDTVQRNVRKTPQRLSMGSQNEMETDKYLQIILRLN